MHHSADARGLRVLVVGGGIGGLSAAIALRRQGHEVEVFEKSELHREIGAAVFVAPNCTAALAHLDIDPQEFGGVPFNGFKFMNLKCELQHVSTYTEEQKAVWPASWCTLNRADLHEGLKQKATSSDGPGTPVRLRTASAVDSVDGEMGTIFLADGSQKQGHVVVCADGIHSRTRASIVGHEVSLFSTGQCCYRWLIPTPSLARDESTKIFVDMPGHFVQIAGADRRIVLYPCGGGKVTNCLAFVPRGEVGEIKKGLIGYDQAANKKQLTSHFANSSEPVLRMLDMAPDEKVMLWDLLDMELQPRLIMGKALLIGDAAHPFLPHMGQGAAQAIEDACALGAILAKGVSPEDIPQRLELWQRCRKDRAHAIVESTRHRARPADGSQGPPQTDQELNAALMMCINHDAWRHAQEQLKAWLPALVDDVFAKKEEVGEATGNQARREKSSSLVG